jgi:hypothetical protein
MSGLSWNRNVHDRVQKSQNTWMIMQQIFMFTATQLCEQLSQIYIFAWDLNCLLLYYAFLYSPTISELFRYPTVYLYLIYKFNFLHFR